MIISRQPETMYNTVMHNDHKHQYHTHQLE